MSAKVFGKTPGTVMCNPQVAFSLADVARLSVFDVGAGEVQKHGFAGAALVQIDGILNPNGSHEQSVGTQRIFTDAALYFEGFSSHCSLRFLSLVLRNCEDLRRLLASTPWEPAQFSSDPHSEKPTTYCQ